MYDDDGEQAQQVTRINISFAFYASVCVCVLTCDPIINLDFVRV